MAGGNSETPSGLARLSTSEVASLLGISTNYASQLVRRGVLVRGADDRFDAAASVGAFIAERELALKTRWSVDATGRRRLTDAKAALAEIELQQRRGSLVPLAEAAEAGRAVIEHVRARILAAPRRLAPRVLSVKDAVAAESVIRRELEQALEELAGLAERQQLSGMPS